MNNYVIYCHTSPSGKKYIGQTNHYGKRCAAHKRDSKDPVKSKNRFHSAIIKYGWNSFTHEILKNDLTLEEANYWEEFYIKELNTIHPNGYNLTTGGLNYKVSEDTKLKMSSARVGVFHSEETKKKLKEYSNRDDVKNKRIEASKNRSSESRAKTSEANKRRGCRTDETKDKLRIANLGKVVSDEVRKKISDGGKKRYKENPVSDDLRRQRSINASKQWERKRMSTVKPRPLFKEI